MYHNSKRRSLYLPPSKTNLKPILLSKAIEGFTLACNARKLSQHTISDYSHTFKIFLAHVGDVPIATIQPAQVTAFLAAQNVSAKTVLNYHVGLSALWTWAVKDGYVQTHIIRKVEKPRPKKVVIQPFTETEVRALFTGIRQNAERDRAVLLLLLDTGMRVSELCGLETKNIDLAAKRIKVLGKGNKERLLPISNRTAAALFKYMATMSDNERPFPFTRSGLGHHIAKIGKRAGVDANPHKFRHTFAITALRLGMSPWTLQELLGHSDMEMTKRYLAIAQMDMDADHRKASPVENWKL